MKICNFDLIILVILMFIVNFFYDTIKKYFNVKEGFDATSDMKAVVNQVYNADIEAIRNLSSIATKLMAGGITIPGQMVVGNSHDNVSNSISDSKYDGNSLCIVGQGVGPNRKVTMWDNVQINGNLTNNGNITATSHIIGKSHDGVSASITDSRYDGNSLCIVGQGVAPNRKITMWDNVQINGNLRVGSISIGDWTITNEQGDQGGSLRFTKSNGRYYQLFGGSSRYWHN